MKINQYYISSASLVLQKQPGELISEGELIFYKPPGIGSPLALNDFSTVVIKMLFLSFFIKDSTWIHDGEKQHVFFQMVSLYGYTYIDYRWAFYVHFFQVKGSSNNLYIN